MSGSLSLFPLYLSILVYVSWSFCPSPWSVISSQVWTDLLYQAQRLHHISPSTSSGQRNCASWASQT
jgi:hypothetical protein